MADEHQKLLVAMNKCAAAQLDLAEIGHQLSRLLDAGRTGYSLSISALDSLKMNADAVMIRAEEIRDFLNEKIGKMLDEKDEIVRGWLEEQGLLSGEEEEDE